MGYTLIPGDNAGKLRLNGVSIDKGTALKNNDVITAGKVKLADRLPTMRLLWVKQEGAIVHAIGSCLCRAITYRVSGKGYRRSELSL